MPENVADVHDLSHADKARLVRDMLHRIIIHYAIWFTEVRHQMGLEKALEILETASQRSIDIQLQRLAKLLGFEMQDGLPAALLNLSPDALMQLMDSVAVNWLANDGVWFQAVEFSSGMNDAKRCNDSSWAHFSPFEAWSIKRFLNLPDHPGLEGLKKALNFRLYARVNEQSFTEEGPGSLVFRMNECRVQSARKRKGLDDYPCQSGGMVEYTYFARSIDPRIRTECIGCPPDAHPPEWYCAWRFTIVED
ncbi:MAG: cytosolic protein [Desulfobacterales bacterium]|nr:MAG: cytosolic protein [Desulfobacterales bacterium]